MANLNNRLTVLEARRRQAQSVPSVDPAREAALHAIAKALRDKTGLSAMQACRELAARMDSDAATDADFMVLECLPQDALDVLGWNSCEAVQIIVAAGERERE